MIRTKGLTVRDSIEDKLILNDINIELGEGEIGIIAGGNNSGKSTLLNTLSGIIPTIQKAKVEGTIDIATDVGVVLQDSDVFLLPTVEEEIQFCLNNCGWGEERISKRIDEMLEIMGLRDFRNREIHTLSGGERQRLALAVAMAPNPSILLLDDPLSQLDKNFIKAFINILKKLSKEGKCILIATTETHHYKELESKSFLIDKGSINEFQKEGSKQGVSVSNEALTAKELKEKKAKLNSNVIALELDKLSFGYPGQSPLLNNLNLKVHKGEVVTLVGENGAGKSTILKLTTGIIQPSQGFVNVMGENIKDLSIAEATKKTGYLLQNPDHQIFKETVSKELQWGLKMRNKEDVGEKVDYWLHKLEIKDLADEHPYSYSKTIRHKIALASILALEPDLLLLDEPNHGMDTIATNNLISLIHELAFEKNMAVLMVTHNHSMASLTSSRIYELNGGELNELM